MARLTECLFAVLLVLPPASAQTVELRSEFLRTAPTGRIVAADATANPRELLSPAVVRNAFASFHIVVEAERGNYFLYVGENPEDIFRTAVYREDFVQRGEEWVPDALKPVSLPNFGVIPDPESMIPGQTTRSYLLDVWVPADAPVGRARIEVQLKVGTWLIAPMEVRVLQAICPERPVRTAAPLPGVERGAAEAAVAPLADFLAGRAPAGMRRLPEPFTIRDVIRRNAEQDMALARTLDAAQAGAVLKQKLQSRTGGGEWYLGVRDWIYKNAR